MGRVRKYPDGPHVYVFGAERPPYKIGYTKNLAARVAHLRLGRSENAPAGVELGEYKLVRLCPVPDRGTDFEGYIHSCYHWFRCEKTAIVRNGQKTRDWGRNEWFDLPLSIIELTIDFAVNRYAGTSDATPWTQQQIAAITFAQHVTCCGFDWQS